MDVRLSAEQVALRDSAAAVVDRLGPRSVGALDDGERAAKLDAAVEAAGWRELRAAADDGAPWASAVEVAIVAEELARGPADVALVGPTLAAELRRLSGRPAAPGRETIALSPDLRSPALVGAGVAVDAAGASAALALVQGELVSIPLAARAERIDLSRLSVPIEVARREGTGGSIGEAALARWTALGLALTSADLVGAMRGATDLAVAYAKDRQQYGAPIGTYQAVQHLLADAHALTEGARSAARHAAWAVDALPPPDSLRAAAVAKAYCARAARTVCETSIQVHGGIGNTWECLAHVFLRRALLSIDVLGGVGASLDRVLAAHGIEGGR